MGLTIPALRTDRLTLRRFTDQDGGELYRLHSDADTLKYWDSSPWVRPEQAARFLERSQRAADEERAVYLAVDLTEEARFLGWCTFSTWNPEFKTGELGYCFLPENWGQGYATEASVAVLDWAYDTLDLNRVQSEVDTRNPASARVLEKLGFTLEGTLRENCVVDGVTSDSWLYSILRREWEAQRRTALQGR
ncbi:MAG: GNAT family N-acetyltransferase [Galactobacter sp.]|uniref:GNAT family N-acetyltransferase n=1 Tax=Galactobacter sp. TaxID=2676125 RepID=UPI0025B8356E|nr:GNAT family N-acetyltransferase [Galactobacter sp.]